MEKNGDIIEYEHYGCPVKVKKHLKGKHKDYCLCYQCIRFRPDDISKNCPIAQDIYELCKKYNLVLPVWECPLYSPNNS